MLHPSALCSEDAASHGNKVVSRRAGGGAGYSTTSLAEKKTSGAIRPFDWLIFNLVGSQSQGTGKYFYFSSRAILDFGGTLVDHTKPRQYDAPHHSSPHRAAPLLYKTFQGAPGVDRLPEYF